MKLRLDGIRCICGKEIQMHNLNHAMCVACGLVFFQLIQVVLFRLMPSRMVKKGKLHLSYKFFLTKLQIQHEKYQNDKYLEHSYLKDKKMVRITLK